MFLTIPFNPILMLALMVFVAFVLIFGWRVFKWFKTGMKKAYEELDKEKGR
jgi:hypothetical protein